VAAVADVAKVADVAAVAELAESSQEPAARQNLTGLFAIFVVALEFLRRLGVVAFLPLRRLVLAFVFIFRFIVIIDGAGGGYRIGKFRRHGGW